MMRNLPQQSVLITGATRGIGNAIANKFAAEGYHLYLVSRQEKALTELQNQLAARYPQQHFTTFAADLRNPEEIRRLCDWADEVKPDILVNNVGIFKPVSILDEEFGDFLPQMHVNYYAAHELSKVVGRQMRDRQNGYIFFISSTASREPVKAGTYTVTKFAMHGLITVLREELRASNVKVTEIVPGSTFTSSWEGVGHAAERFVKADEIADAVAFCLQMSETTLIEEMVVRPQQGNILTDC